MPTATDLVTDLPADFEVFGQAVATSMADLLGGTTGQILSKNSNTDMDFVWIANDQGDITGITATSPLTGGGTSGAITVGIQSASTSQSGAVQLTDSTSSTSTTTAATPNAVKTSYDLAAAAIPKSTVTTNGDLIYGTGSGTVARLGVGSTGQVLTVSSGVPAWGTASSGSSNVAGKNGVLNSNFSVWQRGTSVSGAGGGAYTADRWFLYAGSNGTVSRQATGDTTNLPFIQYCARVGRLNGVTDTTAFPFSQSFESVNSIPFAGKTVTLSFYARKGANYSPASSGLPVVLATGTGTDQNYSSAGFTGGATPISQTATLTTTWQRFSYSATLSASATQLAVSFNYAPVGTAGANDYFEVTGVQLEIASSASAYSPNAATFQGELAACQRYYYRSTATQVYSAYCTSQNIATNQTIAQVPLPVQMRTAPTAVDTTQISLQESSTGSLLGVSALVFDANTSSPNIASILITATGTPLTIHRSCRLVANNTLSSYLGFSAEL